MFPSGFLSIGVMLISIWCDRSSFGNDELNILITGYSLFWFELKSSALWGLDFAKIMLSI